MKNYLKPTAIPNEIIIQTYCRFDIFLKDIDHLFMSNGVEYYANIMLSINNAHVNVRLVYTKCATNHMGLGGEAATDLW